MQSYFNTINSDLKKIYEIANRSRALGYDPEETVEIPLAKDMAERVEGLISIVAPQIIGKGIPERIRALEKEFGVLDWRVALKIADEISDEKFCKFDSKILAIETAIRVGFAYLTLGTVSSPLEGFSNIKIRKRADGKEYFAIFYAGPVRSAGGTAAAVSVLIADFLRVKFGYESFDPTENEIQRAIVECYDYHERVNNLQYLPGEKEIEMLLKYLPVQLDGNPSEDIEVSNYKDIPRIETNKIRNGPCLVLCECVAQKSPKLWKQLSKWGKDFNLSHWSFLEEFIKYQKKSKSKTKTADIKQVVPNYTFIQDLVAGRPILTHPMRTGGFRLRYGRCRNSGYSSTCINPASGYVLNKFVAIGTQLKVERPGKAASIGVCDTIDGPIVKLKNKSVIMINDLNTAKKFYDEIEEITFVGDMLACYGDFFNRNHMLVPAGYNEEWWRGEVKRSISQKFGEPITGKLSEITGISNEKAETYLKNTKSEITFSDAFKISSALSIPIHPRYTYYWSTIPIEMLSALINSLDNAKIILDETHPKIIIPYEEKSKRALELIGIQHIFTAGYSVLEKDDALAFAHSLSLLENDSAALKKVIAENPEKNCLEIINLVSRFKIRDKAGTFIGARMGRPEKAKMRKMTGNPHALFPVGEEGGKLRSFQNAITIGKIKSEFATYHCPDCKKVTIYRICEQCEKHTQKVYYCNICGFIPEPKCKLHSISSPYKSMEIPIRDYFDSALKKLKAESIPDIIKGVKGTSNKEHVIEHLVKGILRAKYDVYVNKDGTIRYDMTQLPITHFKPKEVCADVEKLLRIGYLNDIYGQPLTNEEQILELKPQDIILPCAKESPDEGADTVLHRIAGFIDELLLRLYGQKAFYRLESEKDLIGHYVIVIAPHTSAGIVGRIVGFSQTQGLYAHPMLHAATRRDTDGDEAGIILLMDALLNFSKKYLPSNLGSTQDEPLVLTSNLIPTEIDDMIFDMDICWEYPVELYEAAQNLKMPHEIEIKQVSKLLKTDNMYGPIGFTHHVENMNTGVKCSAYKTLPTMQDKLKAQMELAEKIRAVDEADVARLVIEKHFLRDIKGNFRKFSQQVFRCGNCNEKYRRPPLIGRCTKCNGKIIFTISEGSIIKYLEPAISLANKYNLPPYLKQSLEITKISIESIFGKEREKQIELKKWFG